MDNVTLYQFSPRQIMVIPKNGAYFIREFEASTLCKKDIHNPEWYIQRKILDNEEGYFDFSKNMIDIGACYGTYCTLLPFQTFFMFEPNKEFAAYCHANMLLHGKIYQANIFNVAVSDYTGMLKFDGFIGGELANDDGSSWMQTPCMNVQCVRLDDMQDILKNIGFVKIDIEGMEPYALNGMRRVLKNNNYPPILYESWVESMGEPLEHFKRRTEMLEQFFEEMGYRVLYEWGDYINHLAVHD